MAAVAALAFAVAPDRTYGAEFTLDSDTSTADIIFHLCSIEGSGVAFDRNGRVTGLNFHFCGGLVLPPGTPPPGGPPPGGPPGGPPSVPEPTSLLALGLLGLGAM